MKQALGLLKKKKENKNLVFIFAANFLLDSNQRSPGHSTEKFNALTTELLVKLCLRFHGGNKANIAQGAYSQHFIFA
jgi:hypothetical protein